MGQIQLISIRDNSFTAVSDRFLDEYMPKANGEFVKVYLLLLRYSGKHDNIDLTHVADILNMTEKDVIRAVRYWNETGVLSVSFDGDRQPVSISFADLKSERCDGKISLESAATSEQNIQPVAKTPIPAKTSHSPAQLSRLHEQEDISQLFFIAEQLVGKPLSTGDMNTILYIRDDLNFSPELTEYLVEYCVSNNHTSFRYIETVAVSWYGKKITTVEDAKAECTMYSRRVNPVLKSFGIKGRSITDAELEFINRWYDEYGFDKDIIDEACRRTILSLGKSSFSYADGILRKWKTAGVHTAKDLPALEASVRASVKVPVGTAQQSVNRNNKFSNFPQRDYKYDELEKELIKK